MGLIEADDMRLYMEVLGRRAIDLRDFELREVDLTDPGSDELLPMKGYVEVHCRSTQQRREYPTGDATAWVPAFERDLLAGRFARPDGAPAPPDPAAAREPPAGAGANLVLIISPDPGDVRALRQALSSAVDGPFDVEDVPTLECGLRRIAQRGIDAILLDLVLPDSRGLASFERVHYSGNHSPDHPIHAWANSMAPMREASTGLLKK